MEKLNLEYINYEGISCTPFFVFGSGRCGTTLLRTLLTSNHEIFIPPENWDIPRMYLSYIHNQDSSWNEIVEIVLRTFENSPTNIYGWHLDNHDFNNINTRIINLPDVKRNIVNIIDEIYREYGNKNNPGSTKWGDKTPLNVFYLPLIKKIFGNQSKYIHMIRDGRDVVSSLLKMKTGNYTVEKACLRWINSILSVREFKKSNFNNLIEVKYEELVSNAQKELERICVFIDIPYSDNMIYAYMDADKNLDKETLALEHLQNIKKPINTNSVGKWKKNLTDEEKKCVHELIYNYLVELGYE